MPRRIPDLLDPLARERRDDHLFRIGPEDAEILAKEFYPAFSESDLMSLPNYHIYLKLMIDGAESQPFSGETVSTYRGT